MATSSLVQFALTFCENHDKKELTAYCKTCEKEVCSLCIKEDHTTHDWEMITDILREKKRSLPEECREIRAKQLPGLKKELSRFDKKIDEENVSFERNKSTLNGSRQTYLNTISRLFDDRIDKCKQTSEAVIQLKKGKRNELQQKVEYLDVMTRALDKDINTLPGRDILEMEREMRNVLEKALSYSADENTCTAVFEAGQMDVQVLENMIGEVNEVSLEETNDIDRYSNIVSLANPVSDINAWIKVEFDNYAKLIDKSGEELKTMKTICTSFIVSNGGQFITTSRLKSSVSVLSEEEDTLRTFDTTPLHPSFISKTENDDILVTLKDLDALYDLKSTSRRVVQRMNLTGEVLNTYEFKADGKTRLFTCPTRTVENKNTDVCIVNWLSDDSGELVVLHKDGRLKFAYGGNGLKHEKFRPLGVECDSKCRILFAEFNNRAIHMLSAEGMYLCPLCQYEQLHPSVISIYGADIWCGFREGRVKVFKYSK